MAKENKADTLVEKLLELAIPNKTEFETNSKLTKLITRLFLLTASTETFTNIENFFVAVINLLRLSDRNTPLSRSEILSKKQGLIQTGYSAGVCFFLGNPTNSSVGCKTEHTKEKLENYIAVLQKIILAYLKSVDASLLTQMESKEETMAIFQKTLLSLLYFCGQKTQEPIMSYFKPFFEQINAIVGKDIVRISCSRQRDYMCGRFVSLEKCASSNTYFVLVDQTQSEENNTTSAGYFNRAAKEVAKCGGGSKKTHKNKHRRKDRKSRKSKRT